VAEYVEVVHAIGQAEQGTGSEGFVVLESRVREESKTDEKKNERTDGRFPPCVFKFLN
jgi:hypothetical protein